MTSMAQTIKARCKEERGIRALRHAIESGYEFSAEEWDILEAGLKINGGRKKDHNTPKRHRHIAEFIEEYKSTRQQTWGRDQKAFDEVYPRYRLMPGESILTSESAWAAIEGHREQARKIAKILRNDKKKLCNDR